MKPVAVAEVVRGGAAVDLQHILDSAGAGVAIPSEILELVEKASALAAAAKARRLLVERARVDVDLARSAAIQALLEAGPSTSSPSEPVEKARREFERAQADRDLYDEAAAKAARGIPRAFLASGRAIARALQARLMALLEEARPHAAVLAGVSIDFADPGAIAKLPSPAIAAWKALEPIAHQVDLARLGALGLYHDLGRHDADFMARARVLADLDRDASRRGQGKDSTGEWISLFVGFGLSGPARSLFGKGPAPAFGRTWRWQPELWGDQAHPVARLIAACQAPVPEPVEELDEPVAEVRPAVQRVPIRPVGALTRR